MNKLIWAVMLLTMLITINADDDVISCSSSKDCPEEKPCCSQYGACGTGAYCLGGCDIRYSYNLSACMPMPVMDEYTQTFDDKDLFEDQNIYLGNFSETDWVYSGYIDISDDALLLQMPNQSVGSVLSSTKYLWYGKVSATLKTSRGKGVITAFILYSDVQDEIDFEFVGYNLSMVQSNFYSQGILNYTNVRNSSVDDTFNDYHTYEVDWSEDRVIWLIDGQAVRTLTKNSTYNETDGVYYYPQTPARVQFSLWPGGAAGAGLGTIEWAGGEVDWDSEDIKEHGYYYAFVKNITVTPYDMNSDVAEIHSSNGEDSFDAFLYNNTDGKDTDVYLTNKKTWLGNADASGLDPDNEDDEQNVETLVSSSGSSVITKTTTSKGSANVPGATATTGDTATTTTTNDYDPSAGIGGFVQDSQASTSSSSNSTTSSSKSDGNKHYGGMIAVMMGLGLFFL